MVHKVNSAADITAIKNNTDPDKRFKVGDAIVHKPFEFYLIEPMMVKEYTGLELFPATIGTDLFTLYGYNTSVIKVLGTPTT